MTQRLRNQVAVTAGLMAVTLAVFWPVLHSQFINLDDENYVTENDHVLRGMSWDGLWWAFTNLEAGFWHPLTWLSHMLDCQLFGLRAGGHHLTSLLLHLANTLLLFGVLKRMTGALWRSALVAALFALHPLHVESVAWVAERKDVLSTLFWLLALWAYVRYVQTPAVSHQKPEVGARFPGLRPLASGNYWLVLVFFVCGLMSKPMVVTLPLVLLLLDYWPLNRVAGCRLQVASSDTRRSTLDAGPSTLWALVWEKVPLLVLALVSGVVTLHAERGVGALPSATQFPIILRVANAIHSYASYLWQMIWPSGLAVSYPYPQSYSVWLMAGAATVLVVVTVGTLWQWRRRPWLAVGWLWYGVTLLPVIGLVQVGGHSRADRYTYVPLIGVFIMVAWGLPKGVMERRTGRIAAAVIATGMLCMCAVLSSLQVRYWWDSETLFRHAVKVTADNVRAHYNLGHALFVRREVEAAISEYTAVLKVWPDYTKARNNLGTALAAQGKLAEAVAEYQAALRLDPGLAEVHYNLANVLGAQGKLAKAVAEYTTALQIRPDYSKAHSNLGIVLAAEGKLAEAITEYRAALRLNPEFAEAHSNLANALLRQGKLAEAESECQSALRINPDFTEARFNLAEIMVAQGRTREASAQYHELLRRSPDWPPALGRLAWLLATDKDASVRNAAEAVRLAERLCAVAGNQQAGALDVLAAAYAEAGRFNDAVGAARKAGELTTAAGQQELARRIQERLKSYQSGLPYHE